MQSRTLSTVLSLAALALAVVSAGCSGGAQADSSQSAGSEPTSQSGAAPSMLAVGDTATYESFPAGPQMKKPKWTVRLDDVTRDSADSKTLLARITMTAVADCIVQDISVCAYSGRHFNILLPDGSKVTGNTLGLGEETLSSGSFREGDTVSGLVSFEVGTARDGLRLMYEPYPGQVDPQFGFEIDA